MCHWHCRANANGNGVVTEQSHTTTSPVEAIKVVMLTQSAYVRGVKEKGASIAGGVATGPFARLVRGVSSNIKGKGKWLPEALERRLSKAAMGDRFAGAHNYRCAINHRACFLCSDCQCLACHVSLLYTALHLLTPHNCRWSPCMSWHLQGRVGCTIACVVHKVPTGSIGRPMWQTVTSAWLRRFDNALTWILQAERLRRLTAKRAMRMQRVASSVSLRCCDKSAVHRTTTEQALQICATHMLPSPSSLVVSSRTSASARAKASASDRASDRGSDRGRAKGRAGAKDLRDHHSLRPPLAFCLTSACGGGTALRCIGRPKCFIISTSFVVSKHCC